MTCTFCGCRNADGEHRCRRCGRKPGDNLAADYWLPTEGALAQAVLSESAGNSAGGDTARKGPDLARAVQRPLFPDRQAPNVIPFEEYASAQRKPESKPRSTPLRRTARGAAISDAQTSLDFLPSGQDFLPSQAVRPRTLGTKVAAVIYCDAPVATALHRFVAAVLDWSMVMIGYGLFLLAFALCGGEFVLNKRGLLVFGGTLLLLAFTYGLWWVIAGIETPGMRWTRLRLVTFDGFPPEPRHRVLRFAGSCLSLLTVIGLLWSLADEESLTWPDHISGTFPTPRDSESTILQRI